MQSFGTPGSKECTKFDVVGAELRALQTALAVTPDGDELKIQIAERIKICTRQLLASGPAPLSPS